MSDKIYIPQEVYPYIKRMIQPIMSSELSIPVCNDVCSNDSAYIRIKINHSRENKVKGFYLLMTNGNTYSDKQDEFIVEKKFLKLLDENGITYQPLPLNQ